MNVFISPSTGHEVKAVLFDTFGTVVDWRSAVSTAIAEFAQKHGFDIDAPAFADAWRGQYEPSMEKIRANERSFTLLSTLHRENLLRTLADLGIPFKDLPPDEIEWVNRAWERVAGWPDAIEGLTRLKRRFIIGPLSNGNVGLLTRMAKHASLPWDVIVGSDISQRYKPEPEAYAEAAALLELPPSQVMMAAAHNYDLAAAREVGLATGFVLRATEFGPQQTTDMEPQSDWDITCSSIPALAEALGA